MRVCAFDVGAALERAATRPPGCASRTAIISAVCSNSGSRASTVAPRSSSSATASASRPCARRSSERGLADRGRRRRSAPASSRRRDHGGVAVLGGEVERGDAVAVGRGGVGAGLEQHAARYRAGRRAPPSAARWCRRRRACRPPRLDRAGGSRRRGRRVSAAAISAGASCGAAKMWPAASVPSTTGTILAIDIASALPSWARKNGRLRSLTSPALLPQRAVAQELWAGQNHRP